ncbi:ABC transporter permease [Oceanobacillus caeni]|uniref:Diguanylate cyclase n=1 Tax=Oceanobacillus caeni TaxID=405946 RepID=A0ABR5MH12_9BACI|nr:ABC transporter permease [Oceanobacillus caeni]KKE80017.1 diguanylate cyclase [Bacilli bacterium VT-13-104]PZD86462.1 ABC transporter permease [Bacilli bacterium]KPH71756.1 diguanylate cyclase [Oceanobacillus caeni]MBU8791546.1 ABC transporter permease [Oceanobacillus caeni]MCR1834726.1 ABC transporter permease [Oceanobacillus caeni]
MSQVQLNQSDFEPLQVDHSDAEKIAGESTSYWKDGWRRFRKNKLAIFGVFIIIILGILSFIGGPISGQNYYQNDLMNANQSPSAEHWFGTDNLGRDVFARTWYGAKISLFIGLMAAFIDLVIGVIWGAIAGFFGGKVDEYMMRIADILYGVPYLLVVILLMVILPQGLWTLIIAMTITGWINMARIVRGQVMQLRSEEYVMASRSLGASNTRLMFKHLVPNTLGPILVTLTLTIPNAIFTEAFLSYLGLGVPAPLASWGTMSSDALPALQYYPFQLFFPAFFICLTMLAFNVIGDGMRDALDPKVRK